MTILIIILKFILKIIYSFQKLFRTNNNKIVFISRQSNEISIDFKLISDELLKRNNKIKTIFICNKEKKSFLYLIKLFFITLKQMYHLATSKICIIDSYCIPVSILKHKKSLTIIQIWHANGKLKKSGYQTIGKESGRNKKIAKLMCMHKNYDAVIAGGSKFNKYYEESFNVKENILLNYGLPRIDYLLKNEQHLKNEILKKYPEFKDKKVILYVPTFRTYEINIDDLMNKYNNKNSILIIKPHPKQEIEITNKNIYKCKEYSSTDLLSVADYVITDYSSICIDAAVLNKKVLFYLYDYEKYIKNNGLNLDPFKVLKSSSFKTIEPILDIIYNNKYKDEEYQEFRNNYLPKDLGQSTNLICNYIIKKMK